MTTRSRLLAAAAAALTSVAAFADVRLSAIIGEYKLSPLEAAAAIVIADSLGVKADFIISTGRNYGTTPSVIGPAIVIGRQTNRPVRDVYASYRKHKGWGQVAKDLGIHPGTFNKMRVKGNYSVDEIIWINAVNKRYGWNDRDWNNFRGQDINPVQFAYLAVESDGNRTKAKSSAQSKSWTKGPGQSGAKGAANAKGGKGNSAGGPGKGNGKANGGGKGKGGGNGRGNG